MIPDRKPDGKFDASRPSLPIKTRVPEHPDGREMTYSRSGDWPVTPEKWEFSRFAGVGSVCADVTITSGGRLRLHLPAARYNEDSAVTTARYWRPEAVDGSLIAS